MSTKTSHICYCSPNSLLQKSEARHHKQSLNESLKQAEID